MRKPEVLTTRRSRSGLTLVEAVSVTLLCVALLVALQVYGFTTVTAAISAGIVVLVLTVLWGLAYLRAPDLTTNATVLLVLGLATLSWVPGRLLDMRETARRHTVANDFRRFGQAFQAVEDTGPVVDVQRRFREHERMREAEAATR